MAPTLRPLRLQPRRESARPVRATCTRVESYREDTSDADSDNGTPSNRPTLRSRESMSDDAHGGFHTSVPSPVGLQRPKVTRSSSGSAKRTLFSQASRATHSKSPKKKRKTLDGFQDHHDFTVDADAIPQWQSLPYHILIDVFYQAAPMSVKDPTADLSKSAKWLLALSRVSRSFFEPAIAVFYYAPPTNSAAKLAGLLQLLERDPSDLTTNYRTKVKQLTISAGLSHVRHADLFRLIALTPQLKHLRIYDPTEYWQTKRVFPLSALGDLLTVLDKRECRLHSWEWNKRQITTDLQAVHLHPSFNSLRSLRLYNLDFEDLPTHGALDAASPNKDYSLSEDLTIALSELPELRRLEFQNSSIPGIAFLLCLPSNLEALAFINCHELISTNLRRFLDTHGQHLRELVLAHNRDLNMSFTGHLKTSCPALEVFKMDFNFSSPTSFFYDVEPHFDELLESSAVPSWPTSLRTLHLERLRKWEVGSAERVFDDLIESAPRLVNLRTLIITAILNVDWRDRARLRGRWRARLERTFLRKAEPPNPSRHSIRNTRPHDFDDHVPDTASSYPVKPSLVSASRRHSSRLAGRDSARTLVDLSDDSSGASPAQQPTPEAENLLPEKPVQGMCDTVEIRIDNLRPADVLLTADSFQDEEVSGDDDWNGEDMELDTAYAW